MNCWSAAGYKVESRAWTNSYRRRCSATLLTTTAPPGIAVLLTGDGSGFADGVGFHADLERMHGKGWRIEVLSWRHSCNRRMREWTENVGRFIALDDYYESITFLEEPLPGRPVAEPRYAVPLDLEQDPR